MARPAARGFSLREACSGSKDSRYLRPVIRETLTGGRGAWTASKNIIAGAVVGDSPRVLICCDWKHSSLFFWVPTSLLDFFRWTNYPFFLLISGSLVWFLLSFVHLNDYLGNRLDFRSLRSNHSTSRTYSMSDRLLSVQAFVLCNLEHGECITPLKSMKTCWVEDSTRVSDHPAMD